MKNELLKIGPFTVYGYGLMIAIGVIAAYMVAEKRAEKAGVEKERAFGMVVSCIVGGILGAKLLYIITQLGNIIKDPKILLDVTTGFVVYGGIIGGTFAGYLYARHTKQLFMNIFDLAMPSVALGQAFGRIGCLLAGCCYGKPTESAFHIVFTHSEMIPDQLLNVPLVPTQILSASLDFLNFLFLITIAQKVKSRGQVGSLYLMMYSAGRFVLEFYRGDLIRGSVGRLSTSQFIAIFLELAGVLLFIYCGKKFPKSVEIEASVKQEVDSKENELNSDEEKSE